MLPSSPSLSVGIEQWVVGSLLGDHRTRHTSAFRTFLFYFLCSLALSLAGRELEVKDEF